ncbi:MAG: hypothetical protein GX601_06640 [Anaerolineales bacterium]|nr:hypothetical protein [Anaerolineales bacterium]
MGLARMDDMLAHARRGGYAIGYFEAWDQHSLEVTIEAAEALRAPAIIGFGGGVTRHAYLDHRGIEVLATLADCLATHASVPTAVLINEVHTLDQVARGLRSGCNAAMLSTDGMTFADSVAMTRQVVALAGSVGATVEAELGDLPDARHRAAPAALTDPAQAAEFVARTGVDALAVSIGNVHCVTDGSAPLVDLALLEALRAAVPVPLVLHGGSGLSDAAVPDLIARGVAKINVGTVLKQVFLAELEQALAEVPAGMDVQERLGSRGEADVMVRAQAAVRAEVERRIRLYGSAGQADGWRP